MKKKLNSKKIVTYLMCGAVLGSAVVNLQPKAVDAISIVNEVSFSAEDWPTWEAAINDDQFGHVNNAGYQVSHKGKIWEASWWMNKSSVLEPGSDASYNTGWVEVGQINEDSVVLLEGFSKKPYPMENENNNGGENATDFNVGEGIQWPEQVFAPFVDMTAYVSGTEYSNNGAPNLKELSLQSDTKYFNLGFMQATGVTEGRIDWAWGSFAGLNERNNDGWQYEGIKKSIKELRENGGDVTISFGGLESGALWEVSNDKNQLINAYSEIIEGYGLTRIDFDVEGGIQGYAQNKINAQAVKEVQDATGVEVTLTLPVMDFGLTQDGLGTLQAYLEAGVDLSIVNIMTMCYGPSVTDYAQGSIDAVENTKNQVQNYYKQYASKELTDKEAFRKIGTTTSIGYENEFHPFFSVDMMSKVVAHAKEKSIGQVSFWSVNRDAKIDNGVGKVENRYEYSTISKTFLEETEETELKGKLIIEYKDNTAYVGAELPVSEFESTANRYVLYVNDKYVAESYNGKSYYSQLSKSDGLAKFSTTFNALKKGDVVELYSVNGTPGTKTKENRIALIDSYVAERDANAINLELLTAIKEIKISKNSINVPIIKTIQEGNNRYVIRKNGTYLAESYSGKAYYSSLTKKETENELTIKGNVKAGDKITIELASGKPGSSTKNVLGNILELTITQEMID